MFHIHFKTNNKNMPSSHTNKATYLNKMFAFEHLLSPIKTNDEKKM